jgi:protein-disulfide isomerase
MATLKVPVSSEDHIQGNEKAQITLIEYGDYQCPNCRLANPIIKKLQKHYGEKLRFVFRNLPIAQKHPLAEPSAEAAEFAGEKGHFWEMHDLLFELQPKLSPGLFLEIGETLDLPIKELQEAIVNKKYDAKIQKDFLEGIRSGINGSPSFFINGELYKGRLDFQALVNAIDGILNLPLTS